MLSLPHGRILLAIGWGLVLLTITGSLGPVMPGAQSVSDKIIHFLGYFGLTLWFSGLYPRSRLWIIALGFLCMGAALEVLQGVLTANRQMDVYDLLTNTFGIAVATVLAGLGLSGWAVRVEAWLTRRTGAGKESA